MLDIFLMFWVLAAFGLLVIDRDRSRARSETKPGIRWLRVAAGACLGLACGVKWNGVYYIPAFAALAIAWDLSAWRAARSAHPLRAMLRSDAKWLPLWFIAMPAAACWSGWFASS
jgi:dolichyl-phosphate-mannose-protein mannosyltransferase